MTNIGEIQAESNLEKFQQANAVVSPDDTSANALAAVAHELDQEQDQIEAQHKEDAKLETARKSAREAQAAKILSLVGENSKAEGAIHSDPASLAKLQNMLQAQGDTPLVPADAAGANSV